ncbi:MAG TPA: class I SAM-dependent methyltransferase [Tepidisphaeraceae bacterium]|nr:class I SAM-dependent methyltransferase [Tepidisphaeraceae bacterium]
MTLKETQYWDAVGKVWKEDHPDSVWRAHSDAVNTALLERWLGDLHVERLLKTDAFDEACSQGLFKMLSLHAQSVISIDISAETLAAARERHPALNGAVTDVRRLAFADETFDVIVSNSTLDHFPTLGELESAIGELHRVLRSGGRLVLTLDNPLNPIVALRNALPFTWLNRAGVVPYYVGATCTPRRLRSMVQRAGFEVSEVGAVLHTPRVMAVALSRTMTPGSAMSRRFLKCLMFFESLARWPTRYFTGYFTAISATRR